MEDSIIKFIDVSLIITLIYLQEFLILTEIKTDDGESFGGSFNIFDPEKLNMILLIQEDMLTAMLDASLSRLVKNEKVLPGTIPISGSLELWSDDLQNQDNFSEYSSKLVCASTVKIHFRFLLIIKDIVHCHKHFSFSFIILGNKKKLDFFFGLR